MEPQIGVFNWYAFAIVASVFLFFLGILGKFFYERWKASKVTDPEALQMYINNQRTINASQATTELSEAKVDEIARIKDTTEKGEVLEVFINTIYKALGYDCERIAVMKARGDFQIQGFDQGADNFASRNNDGFLETILIQAKAYGLDKNLDNSSVQEIVSARNLYMAKLGKNISRVQVITTAPDFTSAAKELAKTNGVELLNNSDLKALVRKAIQVKLLKQSQGI